MNAIDPMKLASDSMAQLVVLEEEIAVLEQKLKEKRAEVSKAKSYLATLNINFGN